jgi:GNAT superfamily N-acetyltransferase
MASIAYPTVRGHLDPDDATAIAEVHRRVFCAEYGFIGDFVDEVERDVRFCASRGWPEAGAVWIVELAGRVAGSLAFTFEGQAGDGLYVGELRWFALELELRGSGLGRRMLEELLETAEDQGVDRLELDCAAECAGAGRLFDAYGFVVVAERLRPGWRRGGAAVALQRRVAYL